MAVHVLGMGGTIAASVSDERVRIVPVGELCSEVAVDGELVSEDVLSLASSSISPDDMLLVARRARDLLASGATGVVVTHGTDTMEETAFVLDLLVGELAEHGGVVVTGAMRRASDPQPDGPSNLCDAIRVAGSPMACGLGAVVSFAGEVHAARWVTKVDTTGTSPFSSSPFPLVGNVIDGQFRVQARPVRSWDGGADLDRRVAVVHTWPAMGPACIDAVVADGARGVVIEGVGVLNVPDTILGAIGRAIENGVIVVVTSRARTVGGLDQGPLGHRHLHDLGAIGAYGLTTTKAYAALMVGLARHGGDTDAVRAWFQTIAASIG